MKKISLNITQEQSDIMDMQSKQGEKYYLLAFPTVRDKKMSVFILNLKEGLEMERLMKGFIPKRFWKK